MKSIILLICLATLTFSLTCSSDEDLYNNQCVKKTCFEAYIPRFKTVANGTGIGRIPITFVGNVQFVPGTGNVEVTLKFTDTENDGTMQRDNVNSCLTSKLTRYGSIEYNNGSEYSSSITSTFDSVNGYRVWKFVIPGTDLKTVLIQDASDTKYLTFHGYFGFEFKVADLTQVYYYFNFMVQVQKDMSNSVDHQFYQYLEKDDINCSLSGGCIVNTSMAFCNGINDCETTTATKQLYLNQNVAIIQKITSPHTGTLYLEPKYVILKGQDLYRVVREFVSVQRSPDQTIITINIPIVYSNVQVYVQSELKTSLERRFLTEIIGSEVGFGLETTYSDTLNCIKTSEEADCPSCQEQCANGAAMQICQPCSYNYIIGTIIMIILILL